MSPASRKLARTDPILGRLIQRVGPMTLKPSPRQTPYQALVEAVVYQQLTGKAAATILGRVIALFPGRKFPPPESVLEMHDASYRTAGLSGAKTKAIKDIAQKKLDGIVPSSHSISKMSDVEIIDRLTTIHGVGPWTVEMLLIFKLGRPDVLPSGDYGVRKGFAKVYGRTTLPTPKELLTFGERWRPYRTAAAWYLWRALELPE